MVTQPTDEAPSAEPRGRQLGTLMLAALGVVYGDIGTSPLYAVKECFNPEHGVLPTPGNVLGVLSLIFWSLAWVISLKYLSFVMRVDNHGEGGILALLAIITADRNGGEKKQNTPKALILLGIFGAALLLGDGMITPAISVLSAVEGVEITAPGLGPFVVPITVVILLMLFLLQKRGTTVVGVLFGPVTLLWFFAIGAAGLPWIMRHPEVLRAVNPQHAVQFFLTNGREGFLVLGSVVLCITGGEALYADMGHFGKRPIRVAWYFIVLPALLINYFGQGAYLLKGGVHAVENPFFGLLSESQAIPMVILATAATVVASQALISGAYSLVNQAVQLGYSPRFAVVHTSQNKEGQIYMPEINTALMVCCIALVLVFRRSSGLAAAYGVAVTGTMMATTLLFFAVAKERSGVVYAAILSALFLIFDAAFLSANLSKLHHGGWFTLLVAAIVFAVMTTWKRGRVTVYQRLRSSTQEIEEFLDDLKEWRLPRVSGTAVFMTQNPNGVPLTCVHFVKHAKVLHERVLFLSVVTEHVPIVSVRNRVQITDLGQGVYRVIARYGFLQAPKAADISRQCIAAGFDFDRDETTYFLGRETLVVTAAGVMARWRKRLFVFLSRNAHPATDFFGLPPDRVMELGMQIKI